MSARLNTSFAIFLMASVAALSGCASSTSPAYDGRFGDAVRAMNAQQLIDSSAAKRNEGASLGADGRVVREAMQRHTESYQVPPQGTVLGVGVGAGSAGK